MKKIYLFFLLCIALCTWSSSQAGVSFSNVSGGNIGCVPATVDSNEVTFTVYCTVSNSPAVNFYGMLTVYYEDAITHTRRPLGGNMSPANGSSAYNFETPCTFKYYPNTNPGKIVLKFQVSAIGGGGQIIEQDLGLVSLNKTSVTVSPLVQTTYPGVPVTVTASTGFQTYQWINKGTNIEEATGRVTTLAPTTPNAAIVYRCAAVVGNECYYPHFAELTINTLPLIANNTISSNRVFINSGGNIQITGSAPTGGNNSYTYQWEVYNGSAWVTISGATSANYTPGTITQTTKYRRKVISAGGVGISNEVTYTVNVFQLGTVTPTPICLTGVNITVPFTANGIFNAGNQFKLWIANNTSFTGAKNLATVSGTSSASFNNVVIAPTGSVPVGPGNYYFRIESTNPAGFSTFNATAIAVNNPHSIAGPGAKMVCPNTNTSFTVISPGATFQWEEKASGSSTWTTLTNTGKYSGVTTGTLNITGVIASMDNYNYRCLVTLGSCAKYSTNAVLTVNSTVTITQQPTATLTGCSSGSLPITTLATGVGLTYNWQVSTNNGVSYSNLSNGGYYSGVTSSTLTISNIDMSLDTYKYRCNIQGTCALPTNTSAATLTVNPPISEGIDFTTPILVNPSYFGYIGCGTGGNWIDTKNNYCYGNDYTANNSPDIIYAFYLIDQQDIIVTTCGSPTDTYITILDEFNTVVGQNDNGATCNANGTSEVYLSALPSGGPYYAVIEGSGSATGNITTTFKTPNPCKKAASAASASDLRISIPNPVSGSLIVNMPEDIQGNAQLMLFDLQGNKVRDIAKYEGAIDVTSLHTGLYILKIITEKNIVTEKVKIVNE